jgi:hypothetical protein
MSRASVLARGRVAAALGMQDACTIRRPSGSGTTDPVTGYPDAVLHHALHRQVPRAAAGGHRAGARRRRGPVWVVRFDLQLPVDGSEGLKVDDEVTITAAVNDADLVGRTFIHPELAHKSEATSRRVGMIERTGS